MLGLNKKLNQLVEYDPQWSLLFEEERQRLQASLGSLAKGIEHYGSTAVPGLPAKPILDILVGVLPLDNWSNCRATLEALGYDYAENAGVPGHHIFGRGRDQTERTHLVHVVEFGGESWRTNLAFRDALRRDANLRERYVAAKRQAIADAPEGRARYNELKHGFIEQAKAELY
jgi:GrpB-like predicted nucleotidyltransferase (UPF0157 family)